MFKLQMGQMYKKDLFYKSVQPLDRIILLFSTFTASLVEITLNAIQPNERINLPNC